MKRKKHLHRMIMTVRWSALKCCHLASYVWSNIYWCCCFVFLGNAWSRWYTWNSRSTWWKGNYCQRASRAKTVGFRGGQLNATRSITAGRKILDHAVKSECKGLFTWRWGPQVGEVTFGGLPHLSYKRDPIKMRYYMNRRVTPPKRVTSPTWDPPPQCKQTLSVM